MLPPNPVRDVDPLWGVSGSVVARAQCLQPQMGVGEWVCASDSYTSQIPKSVSSRAGKGLATLLISKGKAPRGLRGLQLSVGSRGLTATPVL